MRKIGLRPFLRLVEAPGGLVKSPSERATRCGRGRGGNEGRAALLLATLVSLAGIASAQVTLTASNGDTEWYQDVNLNYGSFDIAMTAAGGTPPYTFAITSGQLASGDGLTSSSPYAYIGGVATTVGSYTFTVTATDSSSPTRLSGSLQLTSDVLADVSLVTTSLPNGTVNAPYSTTVNAGGGYPTGDTQFTYTWSLTGSLPPGLTLNTATGIIAGTPTTAGSYSFTIGVTDAFSPFIGSSASGSLSITISQPQPKLTITGPASLPTGTQGVAYGPVAFTATGGTGTGYTWSETGGLPTGMSFSPGGVLSGTPGAYGSYQITFKVTDSGGNSATAALTLTIGVSMPAISPTSLPPGMQGVPYGSVTFTATGGTGTGYTWSETGALPTGMTFSAGGVLSGTPGASGSFPITFKVADSGGNAATAPLTLTITNPPPLNISSPTSLPAGAPGVPYSSVTFVATGGTGTGYTWSETGALPTGMTFSVGGSLGGTPGVSGSYPITFKVTDSGNNSATATLTLAINGPLPSISSPTTSLPVGTQGVPYSSVTFTATGGSGTGYTWSESGALPAGMSFSTGGVLNGTPGAFGTFPITFKVTDSANDSGTATLTLTINSPPLKISSPTSLPAGEQGFLYNSVTFVATGGTGTGYTWSETPALPTGMNFSSGGVLSGTPGAQGSYSITFTVTDSGGHSAPTTLTLTINPSNPAVSISSPTSLTGGTQGVPYSAVTFVATGGTGSGYTWSETGQLPTGMTFSAGGVLSGTPGAMGSFQITFKVTDSGSNSATVTLTLTINPPVAQLTVSGPTSLPAGTQGTPYSSVTFAATGGTGIGYTWSETGALPTGMTFSAGGVLSGTPTASGQFTVTFKVTDSGSNSATATLTLTIANTLPPLTISGPTSLPTGAQGNLYSSVTFTATGGTGAGYAWSEAGALPSGMSFSAAGVLSGTPGTQGSYTIAFKVTDSGTGSATTTLTLTINPSNPAVAISSPTSLPAGTQGAPYGPVTFTATGGAGAPYSWSETGALPSGMSFSAGGVLSGTPANYGVSTITFKVTDSGSGSATISLTLTINPGLTIGSPTSLSAGTEGVASPSVTFVATGGTGGGYTWSVSGQPNGLTINSTSGAFGGTPAPGTSAGSPYTVTVTVMDSGGDTNFVALQLVVHPPPSTAITVSTNSLSFSYIQGSATPQAQSFGVSGVGGQVTFNVSASTTSGGSWLTASPPSEQTLSNACPRCGNVTVGLQNLGSLGVGTYQGSVQVTPQGATGSQNVSVTLQVSSATPQFSLSSADLRFTATTVSSALSGALQVINAGGGSPGYTANLDSPASWLSITCGAQGSATAGSPGQICLQLNPGILQPGTYTDMLDVIGAGQELQATVTLQVSSAATSIVLSATAMTFTAIAGSPIVSPAMQSSAVLNGGAGTMNWIAQIDSSTSAAASWLSLSSASGTSLAFGASQPAVSFTPNPMGMGAGDYYALVDVIVPDGSASNSPVSITILLRILPAGRQLPPTASVSGLIFTAPVGGSVSGTQPLSLINAAGASVDFTCLLYTALGSAGQQVQPWLAGGPTATGTIPGSGNILWAVSISPAGLAPGTYYSELRLGFSNGTDGEYCLDSAGDAHRDSQCYWAGEARRGCPIRHRRRHERSQWLYKLWGFVCAGFSNARRNRHRGSILRLTGEIPMRAAAARRCGCDDLLWRQRFRRRQPGDASL